MAECCGHRTGSIKDGEFRDWMSNSQFLKMPISLAGLPSGQMLGQYLSVANTVAFQMLSISSSNYSGKGKVRPGRGHEGPEGEQNCGCTLSLTAALDVDWCLTSRPGRFTPGKDTRYPLCRRLGGPHGRSGRVRKISFPRGFELQTAHVAIDHCVM